MLRSSTRTRVLHESRITIHKSRALSPFCRDSRASDVCALLFFYERTRCLAGPTFYRGDVPAGRWMGCLEICFSFLFHLQNQSSGTSNRLSVIRVTSPVEQALEAAEIVDSRDVLVAQALLPVRGLRSWLNRRRTISLENRTAKSGCATRLFYSVFRLSGFSRIRHESKSKADRL